MNAPLPFAEPLVDEYGAGGGWQDTLAIASPAAGAALAFKVPGDRIIRPISIALRFVTSAVVGARAPVLEYLDADGVLICGHMSSANQAASINWQHCWSVENHPIAAGAALLQTGKLTPIFLVPGFQIRCRVAVIDAGDQISEVRLTADMFSTDARQRNSRSKGHRAGG